MIIGSGTLAKVFLESDYAWDDCIILAAGVSNSMEESAAAYQREQDLIDSFLGTDKRVVYFSTVSIYDPQKGDTAYVQFKKRMEAYIAQSFDRSLIVRLPIVVSSDNNVNQLFGHIRKCIQSNEKLTLFLNASRYLFDAEEVPKAVSAILANLNQEEARTKGVNVGFQQPMKMELLGEIIVSKYPALPIEKREKGESYYVDFSEFEEIADGESYVSRNSKNLVSHYL
jgi:hypothetical protein